MFPEAVASDKDWLIAGEIMSHGRPFHSRSLQLLLFALAIQAISPDSQDLASIQALKVMAPGLTDLDSASQQDEWPDDVCEPVPSAARVGPTCREDLGSPTTTLLTSVRLSVQSIYQCSICAGSLTTVRKTAAVPLCLLGRLIC
jgi:hypothetical protein